MNHISNDSREVICVNDRYDPEPSEYRNVGEFIDMCVDCFGEAPELHEHRPGEWVVERGHVTLELS